jgi:hypothetical protein
MIASHLLARCAFFQAQIGMAASTRIRFSIARNIGERSRTQSEVLGHGNETFASSLIMTAVNPGHRRVLHFECSSFDLPDGLK